ncbi:hypothetical protein LCGC14_2794660, partial [marine sediment metagenome]
MRRLLIKLGAWLLSWSIPKAVREDAIRECDKVSSVDSSGEQKRHTVYALLIKKHPTVR